MSNVKFSKQELTRQSRAIIAASDNGWFKPSDFKGQDYVPHNPRKNRKTKKAVKNDRTIRTAIFQSSTANAA